MTAAVVPARAGLRPASQGIPFYDVGQAQAEAAAEIEAALVRVARSGRYVLGPEVEAFEAEWAAACEVRHAIGVGNGLDALSLVLGGLGIGPGDEVIVPSHTFVATWLAVTTTGATPVAVEVDATSGLLDPAAVEAAVTPRTAAIVPVHLYGQTVDMDGINDVAARYCLAVVEDAAQAHLARWRNRPAGALGVAGAFSFYPGKNLGALGDGGAVTTDDDALARRVRQLANYGASTRYVHEVHGVNSRLDEVQAAVLRVKLRHLPEWNQRRSAAAAGYLAGLAGVDGLTLPACDRRAQHVWHLFVVRHAARDELVEYLARHGVETLVHYPVPPHQSGAYALTHGHLSLPVAESWASTCVSLPFGPALTATQQAAVISLVRDFTA